MSDDRKDLPPVTSPNFLEKVREALQTYLGNRGNKLDRGLTLRDLADAGLVEVSARYLAGGGGRVPPIGGAGPAVAASEPDLTPPPTPTGFAAAAAISNLLLECDAPTYTQGNGHAKSVLYGATWTSGPLPVFAGAVRLTEFSGNVASYATNPASTWHLWLTWVTVDGVESEVPAGGTNGVVVTTGQDVALLLDALTGAITEDQLFATLGTRIDLIDAPTTGLVDQVGSVNAAITSINATLADLSGTPAYDNATAYALGDIVTYSGGLYRASAATTGNLPTNASFWSKIGDYASIGDAVAGHSVILSDHETRVDTAEGSITSLAGRATVLEAAVNNATTGLATKASVAYVDQAEADAISAAAVTTAAVNARLNSGGDTFTALTNVTNSVATKSANFVQSTTPTATRAGDLWIDTANGNVLKRWSGSAWLAADDTRIGSTASSLTTLQTTVTNNNNTLTSAVSTEASTRATQTGELYAQYTVKTDIAGHVSGYGLASTLVGATPKSAFGVRADKFWVAPPVGYTQATAPTATSWGTGAIYAITKGIALLAVGASSGAIVGGSAETWVRATNLATVWGSVQANAVCYGGGVYLVVGASGKAATSPNGKTWTNQTGLAATSWSTTAANAVCYGNGVFVVIGDSGKCAKGVYNPVTGAVTWTYTSSLATLWASSAGYCLLFSNGAFWAFGAGGKMASSVDGITWTALVTGTSLPTAMASNAVRAAVVANGMFVVVGDSGKVATSTDGSNWTARASLAGTTWGTAAGRAIVHNGSIFVVVGDAGKAATSVDAITWTYRGGLLGTTWGTSVARAALASDGMVIVVGDSGKVAGSMDGVTWTYTTALSKASVIGEGTVWVDTSVTPNVTKYYVNGAWVTTSPDLPFVIAASPDIVDGIPVPAGVYMDAAYIKNGTITNAKIGFAAIDDAKVANLSASKLTAGTIDVGQYIQSSGYVAGSAGWRINGNGNAEFSGVVVRGTIYATTGQIGGNTIDSTSIHSGTTGYGTGAGFYLGSDGRFSLSNKLTWDGSVLNIVGGGTFSGALSAATGTFAGNVHGGQFTTGAFTGYAWPAANNYGTYLGPSGLLIGNANNGKYLQVTQDGNIYTPGFNVVNGTMTVNQANVINTLNIAGNAVTVPEGATLYSEILLPSAPTYLDVFSLNIDALGQKIWITCSGSTASRAVTNGEPPVTDYYYGAAGIWVDGVLVVGETGGGAFALTTLISGGGMRNIKLRVVRRSTSNPDHYPLSIYAGATIFALGAKR